MGKWVGYVVDDLLPVQRRYSINATSADSGELWTAYAEKAYAQRYGGYDHINSGKEVEGTRVQNYKNYATLYNISIFD